MNSNPTPDEVFVPVEVDVHVAVYVALRVEVSAAVEIFASFEAFVPAEALPTSSIYREYIGLIHNSPLKGIGVRDISTGDFYAMPVFGRF